MASHDGFEQWFRGGSVAKPRFAPGEGAGRDCGSQRETLQLDPVVWMFMSKWVRFDKNRISD